MCSRWSARAANSNPPRLPANAASSIFRGTRDNIYSLEKLKCLTTASKREQSLTLCPFFQFSPVFSLNIILCVSVHARFFGLFHFPFKITTTSSSKTSVWHAAQLFSFYIFYQLDISQFLCSVFILYSNIPLV